MRAYSLLLTSALTIAAMGQSGFAWDRTFSQNWTVTDINGGTHALYDYLDQGYTVILDFGTTWCEPCWDVHMERSLDSLYDLHGPGTALADVVVLFFEIDPATGMNELMGSGNTQGDWVTGTTYPIIDETSVAELYGVVNYPTLIRICPDRFMTYHWPYATLAEREADCAGCEHLIADSPHDAALIPLHDFDQCAQGTIELQTRLHNVGTEPITHATIEALLGDSILLGTLNWTGDLVQYEDTVLTILNWTPALDTDVLHNSVTFRSTLPDDDAANNSILQGYVANAPVLPSPNLRLELLTDAHPEETFWTLWSTPSAFNAYLLSSVQPGELQPETLYNFDWFLSDAGCFQFTIADIGGNGLQGDGHFKIWMDNILVHDGTAFTEWSDQFLFTTDFGTAIAPTEASEGSIQVRPNPSTGAFVIETVGLERVEVFDPRGARVAAIRGLNDQARLELGQLATGVFVGRCYLRDGRTRTVRLVVSP